jgi:CRP-like cAMP-binding protein
LGLGHRRDLTARAPADQPLTSLWYESGAEAAVGIHGVRGLGVEGQTWLSIEGVPLWAVADATGRKRAGTMRAALDAVKAGEEPLRKKVRDAALDTSNRGRRELDDLLEKLFIAADKAAVVAADDDWSAGSLLVAVLCGSRMHIATVGNCQAWLSRKGELTRISRDRSSEAIGTPLPFDVDIAELDLDTDDRVLLCTGKTATSLGEAGLRACLDGKTVASEGDTSLIAIRPDVRPQSSAEAMARIVGNLFLFCTLDGPERLAVAPYLEDRLHPAGTVLMKEEEPGTEFLAIVEGTVRVTRGDRFLRNLGVGDHLGELALVGAGKRSATATCSAPTWVVAMKRADFEAIVDRRPEIGVKLTLALLQTVSDRLRDLTQRFAIEDT